MLTFSFPNLKPLSTCTGVLDLNPYCDGKFFVTFCTFCNVEKNKKHFKSSWSRDIFKIVFFVSQNLGLFRSSAFSFFLIQNTTSPQ